MRKQQGFTLIELAVVLVVLVVMFPMIRTTINWLFTAQSNAYIANNRLNNQSLAAALSKYTINSTVLGRLPAPYTGAGYTKTVYNPADATAPGIALEQAITASGVPLNAVNDDGKTAQNVRVYQLVQGLVKQVPLYFQSGALVNLTYDYGAIYMTSCPKATAGCNPTAATGVPGGSLAMTAGNFTTWVTAGTDDAPTYIEDLTIQKQMLATTVQRLDKVRDSLLTFLRTQQVTAGGGDTTNWYTNQAGLSVAGLLTGANPVTNQGCRDGWYSLAATNVLPSVGLAAQEFGVTAWGGTVEYCRDYDPLAVKVANAAPHYAALRILANVSNGAAPDNVVPGNNVVLTF